MSSTPTHGSDTQIPGWWIASDGRWYPPETHPNYVPPAPEPPPVTEPPAYTAPVAEVATPDYTAPVGEVATPDYMVPDYSTPSVSGAADSAVDATAGVGGGIADAAGGVTGKLGDVAGGIGDKLGGGAAMAGGVAAAGAAAVGGGASGLVDKAKDMLPGTPDLPDVSLPDVSLPSVSAPDVSAPSFAMPDTATPVVPMPEVPQVTAPSYETPAVSAHDASVRGVDAVSMGEAVPVVDPEPATILVPREEAVSALQEPIEVVTPSMPEVTEVQTPVVDAREVLAAPTPVVAHAAAPEPIPGTYASPSQPVVASEPVASSYTAPTQTRYPAPDPIIQIDKPKRRSVFAGLLALAAGVLAIVGSLMQWANGTAETGGTLLRTIDVQGMDSNGLGTLIAGGVLCLVALFLLFGIGKQSFWGLVAFLAAAVIGALVAFSYVDISGLDESHADALRGDSRLENGALRVVVTSAIGLWLATAGAVLGVLAWPFAKRGKAL